MRGLAPAIAVALAACSNGVGVALEVTSEVEIDRVEVFVATEQCHDDACEDGVGWHGDLERPAGPVYYMIDDEAVIATTQVEGDRFVLNLRASPSTASSPLIAVVGFRNDDAVAYQLLRDARIPVDHGERWSVVLEAASIAKPDATLQPPPSSPPRRVHAWKRERSPERDELSRCLVVQKWLADDQRWASAFIVPASDPDCDGLEPECRDHHANFNVNGEELACVTSGPAKQFGDVCVLVGTRCADGTNSGGCAYVEGGTGPLHCLPSGACARCAGRDDDVASCLRGAIEDDQILHAPCAVSIDVVSGRGCGVTGGGTASISIEMRGSCVGSELRYAAAPLTSVPLPLVADQVRIVEVRPQDDFGVCRLELVWTGQASQGQIARFLAVLDTGTNYLYVPVRLEFKPTPGTCSANTPADVCEADPSLATDSIAGCF
jgi:hypothetical protein